jgi:precorrin-6B methylase 1
MAERATQIVVLAITYNPVDEYTDLELGGRKDKASNWNWSEILEEEVVVIASGDVMYFEVEE